MPPSKTLLFMALSYPEAIYSANHPGAHRPLPPDQPCWSKSIILTVTGSSEGIMSPGGCRAFTSCNRPTDENAIEMALDIVTYRPRFGCDSQARTPQLVWTSWRGSSGQEPAE